MFSSIRMADLKNREHDPSERKARHAKNHKESIVNAVLYHAARRTI